MTMRLNPYLTFPGNAAEAMAFYQDVLGGDLQVMTFKESGMDVDGVMHASLLTGAGFAIFASDQVPGMGPDRIEGNNIQISLSGDEADALRSYWDKLTAEGTVVMPLEKQMWGDIYGLCTDKYGIAWHVNIADAAN